MVTVLWIIAAIICVALCAYGITTAIRRSRTAIGRMDTQRRGAEHHARSLPPRPQGSGGSRPGGSGLSWSGR
jgi:hypothetical protein